MTVLTTRQRDILHLLLESNKLLGSSELAAQLQLTSRQVNYDLKGLRVWLARQDIILNAVPGVGVELICSSEKQQILEQELSQSHHYQLVLTIEQRRQMIALTLLVAGEPIILYQLQQWAQLSRSTILKDLVVIEEWFEFIGLSLDRRPNFGFELVGHEQVKRQAIATLLWGQTPFGEPITKLNYVSGLTFDLGADAELLPIIKGVKDAIDKWDTRRALVHVAYAEAQMGGRFTDDAVRYLALVFAIQTERVQSGNFVSFDADILAWLQSLDLWSLAATIARHLGRLLDRNWPTAEIAYIAMHVLTAPRNERWPDDLEIDQAFSELIDELMANIVNAYGKAHLVHDMTLRDGLVIHIIPACLRHRLKIRIPNGFSDIELSEKYLFERELARDLAKIIEEKTAVTLPESEINNITLLLRAAYIREYPRRIQEVIVVCPSGMATAQLLVARINARFPRIGTLRVVSLRDLTPAIINAAGMVITTVPLPDNLQKDKTNIIQVHPLLLPEDIEKITARLALE
ncbi:MAG: PRD domain-containing protein [Anaerolineales bacterium]|nr:PRD domain-containing protein [Anaerolineales bacterium]